MLRIELHFCAGRYHATPWGRHVNEGAIEWPPSPWRMGRALIATGFAKAGWSEVPENAAGLIVRLASTPPVYYLPPATAAHTRHYMSTPKGVSKVIDAFAYPGRAGMMIIEWDITATEAECAILDALLARMAYLGRAESWIEAQRVERVPHGLSRCAPGDGPPGPAWERLELMALIPAADYAAWRERTYQREAARRLERQRQRAREQGRRRPRGLSKSARARLEAELPATCMDALCADTAELRRAGWSRPPGARWLTYWRPGDALDACPTMGEATASAAGPCSEPHRVAVLALVASAGTPRLPLVRDALPRCEALHRALVSQSAELHPEGASASCFTGRDEHGNPLQGHRHTTLMPLGLGDPERLGQVVLYTPMGLDAHAVAAVQRVRVLGGTDPPLGVLVTGLGQPEQFAGRIPALGTARVWESCTPFVPPRYLKASGTNALAGQVRAELAGRGLPEPLAVEIQVATSEGMRYVDGAEFWAVWKGRRAGMRLAERWRRYKRVRRGAAPKPPIAVPFGLRITFAEPVRGPVSLGYGSHFGLGLFMPSVGPGVQRTLDHVPRRKRDMLTRITAMIRESAPVAMVILFGSHARGDWVEDPAHGYMSDFDILVLVSGTAPDEALWADCEERARDMSGDTLVSLIVHTIEDVNRMIARGNSFFRDVLTEGIALYDAGGVELAEITALTRVQRYMLAQEAFPGYFERALQSYEAFQYSRDRAWRNKAAFELHQCAELVYKAILLVFAGYRPKTQDVLELDRICARVAPEIGPVIPANIPESEHLAELLRSAYVEARYSPAFQITRGELDALAHCVSAFHARAERACRARLQGMSGLPRAGTIGNAR